jgi:aryl-alcohol dehydrogenase-like predicted oxidoreductase
MSRRIGGLQVPAVGLGCNSFGTWADEASSLAVVDAALENGATFFETADYYGNGRSEEILGRALAGRRDRAIIATKFGIMGMRPGRGRADAAFIHSSLEASLRRLQTDWIDLYQLHFPDPDTPIEDTLGVLAELVEAGKVREFGMCNVTAEHVDATAATDGPLRLASVQNEWSLLRRGIEDELLPACRRHEIPVIPYFPLASGLLTGKYERSRPVPEDSRFAKAQFLADRYMTDAAMDVVDELTTFAQDHGHTLLELALSWLAGQPEVATVIVGASRPDQVRSNVAAAASWNLSAEDRAVIASITARLGQR